MIYIGVILNSLAIVILCGLSIVHSRAIRELQSR